MQKIANSQLRQEIGHPAIVSLLTRDSKQTLGIQLADLLLGAIMSDTLGVEVSDHKAEIRRLVAQQLGWPDLAADTTPGEWKFNIWYFYDPTEMGPREAKTRPVRLLVPMPPLPTRRR